MKMEETRSFVRKVDFWTNGEDTLFWKIKWFPSHNVGTILSGVGFFCINSTPSQTSLHFCAHFGETAWERFPTLFWEMRTSQWNPWTQDKYRQGTQKFSCKFAKTKTYSWRPRSTTVILHGLFMKINLSKPVSWFKNVPSILPTFIFKQLPIFIVNHLFSFWKTWLIICKWCLNISKDNLN